MSNRMLKKAKNELPTLIELGGSLGKTGKTTEELMKEIDEGWDL